jgi:hypothetical protein
MEPSLLERSCGLVGPRRPVQHAPADCVQGRSQLDIFERTGKQGGINPPQLP